MKKANYEARKVGLKSGIMFSVIYLLVISFVVLALQRNVLFFAYLGCPIVFILFYTFSYDCKAGFLKFLSYDKVMNLYDNPIDNCFRSEYDKVWGSIILPVLCFLPTLLFYILFGWIFYLCHIRRSR